MHLSHRVARARVVAAALAALASAGAARPAQAQTDYYNTDRGRPVQVEDAYATERYAFELKLAPVRLERAAGGAYRWEVEPEIAYGILPRTHVEVGLPVSHDDRQGAPRSGLSGIDLSVMHNLNVETRTLPAFGLRADLLAPVGGLAPDRARATLTAMATRTLSWMRFHLNGQYTFGAASDLARAGGDEPSRWMAGVAADRVFPLQSILVTGELYASRPVVAGEPLEHTVGTGVRYQWSPRLALDAGVGRRLTGDDRAWYVTFGSAYAFGLASLIPDGGR